jgi:hypothetical protein
MKKFNLILAIIAVIIIFTGLSAEAVGPNLVEQGDKYNKGDYTANDLLLVGIRVTQWVLILSGSLALLAFVVGGFMFILSAGNKDLVQKGKNSLIAAVIGLAVVLLAFTAINYFMTSLGYDQSNFGGAWNVAPN